MAGLGFKDFTVGQVLTSAQVDGYLMQQTVMVFDSASARTTALSGVVAEGMFSYLKDTNSTEYYDGSSWVSVSNPGDITAVTAGTGLSGGGTSGGVTLAIDTATTVDKTTAQTLTKKTLTSARETTTVSATAATGTINFDVLTQGVLIYTTSASATWVLNVRGDGSTSLNTVMATGETQTIAFIAAQGSTAYYPTALNIDGSAQTVKWQGGTAPTAGNASSDDSYVYSITKTGSATFRVYASQTKFA